MHVQKKRDVRAVRKEQIVTFSVHKQQLLDGLVNLGGKLQIRYPPKGVKSDVGINLGRRHSEGKLSL